MTLFGKKSLKSSFFIQKSFLTNLFAAQCNISDITSPTTLSSEVAAHNSLINPTSKSSLTIGA